MTLLKEKGLIKEHHDSTDQKKDEVTILGSDTIHLVGKIVTNVDR